VNYGALLCTFQLRGKNTAACEFRDIDGKVWDSFTISTKPGEKANDIELVTKSKDIPMSSYYSVPMHDGVFTFGKGEHYLLFDVDVPANAQITQAYLQLLLFSTSSVQPPVKMTIEVLGTSPKFIQQTKTKLIQVKAETVVDSGHVWNSPNLASLIQPFASQKVVVVITSDIDYQGAFGFLQSHPILKSCVSPTLFITFQ
jgi:hypothetical protein